MHGMQGMSRLWLRSSRPNERDRVMNTCCPCRLALCEKALAEYLETKRVAFPRFYFISSADLLDILSKGAQPKQVKRIFFFKVSYYTS